jgi:TolB-like protein
MHETVDQGLSEMVLHDISNNSKLVVVHRPTTGVLFFFHHNFHKRSRGYGRGRGRSDFTRFKIVERLSESFRRSEIWEVQFREKVHVGTAEVNDCSHANLAEIMIYLDSGLAAPGERRSRAEIKSYSIDF